jgi:uncharacterized membrane protein (UPF0127 family)
VKFLMPAIQVFSLWLMLPLLSTLAAPPTASDFGHGAGKTPRHRLEKVAIVRIPGKGPGAAQQTGSVILRVSVEVASDGGARSRGLSGRRGLAENSGMLFVLDEGRPAAFWMKGMRFPLDLLYFDSNRKLIKILSGLQPCTDCPVYQSPEDTAYVIEVAAGSAGKYGIRTGDFFTYTGKAPGENGQ